MNPGETKNKSAVRTHIAGAALYLAVTVTARVLSLISASVAGSGADSAAGVLSVFIYLFDGIIFAVGAGYIARFLAKRGGRGLAVSFSAVIIILALDYAVAYVIDFVQGNLIGGLEAVTALYLVLNVVTRALTYFLLYLFCRIFLRSATDAALPAPLFSKKHPFPRIALISFLLRIVPYIINEIAANIEGIVKYGWDMTSSDVISILSAYGEILVDGTVVYLTVYLTLVLLTFVGNKTDPSAD